MGRSDCDNPGPISFKERAWSKPPAPLLLEIFKKTQRATRRSGARVA